MREKEKMLAGKPYRAFGEELLAERQAAKELIFEFNAL
ncbi:MAG: maltose O-acetyltransferase, partial [Alphaproteobacteria bacterium]